MSYSKEQIMLTFAYMSYYGIAVDGSDERNDHKISELICHALQTWKPIQNQWQLVWGPCVSAFKGDLFDDNMMFIVQNIHNPEQYVVSIRGTNPFSVKDWLIEDFHVESMKKWPYGVHSKSLKPKISKAAFIGLGRLQNMRPVAGMLGESKTVLEFFQSKPTKSQVTVTGHSLGGALAPTFALWLKDVQSKSQKDIIDISIVAFAGPSAGNRDFAQYSDASFGDQCIRVANNLDVVPHAWNRQSILKLYTLYASHFLFPGPVLSAGFGLMLAISFRGNYTQIKARSKPLQGHFKHLLYQYFSQAIYQHVIGYPESMGLLSHQEIPLIDLFSSQLKFLPTSQVL